MPSTIPPRPNTERQLWGAALGLASLIAVFAAGAVSYASANLWLHRMLHVRQEADDWFLALLDAEAGARGYIISAQSGFLAPYESALRGERAKAAIVKSLVRDDAIQVQNIEVAERDIQRAMNRLRELVELVRAGRRDEAIARLGSGEGERDMAACRQDARRIRLEQERLLAESRAQAGWRAWWTLLGGILLTLASSALLRFAWRRERRHDQLLNKFAIDARQQLAVLFDVTASLSKMRTRAQVAEVIVDQGMRAAGADTCTLYALDDAEKVLELIGDRGGAPAVIDKIRQISETAGNPDVFVRMRAGTFVWAETEADYAALFPAIATMKAEGRRAKAFWSAPLYVEGRAIGLLGMGFYAPRQFSSDDRAFVEAFTKQCAQALLRAVRLEREDESNRWFTTTLRSIGDAVIATDASGRIVFMNPIAEGLTRWTESDARGRPLEEVFCIFSEETRAPIESPVAKVLREGKVVGLANHTLLRAKNGKEIPIDDSGAPIRNEAGDLFGVVLVFRDVTQEKRTRVRREFLARAGEVLASSLDYQTTLATIARLAVPTLADWCSIDVMDPAAGARQVGVAHIDPSKMQFAREFAERYPPDRNAATGAPNVMRTGKSELYTEIPTALLEAGARDAEHLRMIRELRLESGMVVPLRTGGRTLGAMTFIYAESGRRYNTDDLAFAEDFARGAALAIENALVLKEAEEAQAKERSLRSEAESASRAKDEFLATVSHELRTPLNAILGWTVMLRGRKPDAEIERGLAIIERNARAQTKLIEDVLDVSRIISGKLALSLSPTNVAEAISSAIETVTPAADAKSIVIAAELGDVPLSITADPDRLQQIVWNLLSNAVKFTPKGGHVAVRVHSEGSNVCIAVRDSGEGIRPDALPLIFEPFHQADASTTRRHGGLGLGLAIVKQLVSAHGGTVRAKSDGNGHGATFIVELPARSVVPAIGRSTRPSAPVELAPTLQDDRRLRLDGLRVLVVDDEQDALAMVSEVLRERGADVHFAGSALEALEKFAAIKPDVMVSDIGMPEMDGYSLIRKIRALPVERGGRTPAVALTAYARVEDSQRAFAAGYQMHVVKPVEPAQLITVVANLGGRSLD
jgi:PAS domain S-box-containing protein